MERKPEVSASIVLADPRSKSLQKELGLTERQIVLKAGRLGLKIHRVYGRTWIAQADVDYLKSQN